MFATWTWIAVNVWEDLGSGITTKTGKDVSDFETCMDYLTLPGRSCESFNLSQLTGEFSAPDRLRGKW